MPPKPAQLLVTVLWASTLVSRSFGTSTNNLNAALAINSRERNVTTSYPGTLMAGPLSARNAPISQLPDLSGQGSTFTTKTLSQSRQGHERRSSKGLRNGSPSGSGSGHHHKASPTPHSGSGNGNEASNGSGNKPKNGSPAASTGQKPHTTPKPTSIRTFESLPHYPCSTKGGPNGDDLCHCSTNSDGHTFMTEIPATSTVCSHITTYPGPTTTSTETATAKPHDDVFHEAFTASVDAHRAVLAWPSYSVNVGKIEGVGMPGTRTLGLGPASTVSYYLPTASINGPFSDDGLSTLCDIAVPGDLGAACDGAAHQFLEKHNDMDLEFTVLKSKTARWETVTGKTRCMVSYKCDDDDDYGIGLTGRQVYELYWAHKGNGDDKFQKCAHISWGNSCRVKVDVCVADCPAWNDNS